MKYVINVSNIPEDPFSVIVRQGASKQCTGKDPDWVTDLENDGISLSLQDVMMQAGRHFADRINPETFVGCSRRQAAMALCWAIASITNPSVAGELLVVEDPGDPDVKRLCSEIFGVGLGLEVLRVCDAIDARTLKKLSARFDFEAYGPGGGRKIRIEAKGTFNNVSSSRHRASILDKITDLNLAKRYNRAIGIIASLWTGDRTRSFDIEITDPEREPEAHFEDAVREIIRFYAHRFDEAVGNEEGVKILLAIANDPNLFAEFPPDILGRLGTDARPSRMFWRGQVVMHLGQQSQHFLGAFWERHKLPVPLSFEVKDGETAEAFMAVDSQILDLIRNRNFQALLSYKPLFSGLLISDGPDYRSAFHLDSYGVLRGLKVGELPHLVEVEKDNDRERKK